MPPALRNLQPRKRPVQARSQVTVDAIQQAAVQVLLRDGPGKLTTVRVAQRAGISVGTLYQYFPHKQAVLFAVLEHHLAHVMDRLIQAAVAHHGQPLQTMLEAVVSAFVQAKLAERPISTALYRLSSELEGQKVILRLRAPAEAALEAMFRSSAEVDGQTVAIKSAMFFAAMGGILRAQLESPAIRLSDPELTTQLVAMGLGFLRA